MAYTIQINEYQRDKLTQLLSLALSMPVVGDHFMDQRGDYEDNALEELRMLWELFCQLPNAEKEVPGAIHGFCV